MNRFRGINPVGQGDRNVRPVDGIFFFVDRTLIPIDRMSHPVGARRVPTSEPDRPNFYLTFLLLFDEGANKNGLRLGSARHECFKM